MEGQSLDGKNEKDSCLDGGQKKCDELTDRRNVDGEVGSALEADNNPEYQGEYPKRDGVIDE